MRGAGLRAPLTLLGVGLIAAAALAFVVERKADAPPSSLTVNEVTAKPRLMLLTSLPLMFAEQFGLDGGGSPALAKLAMRYRVMPIGIADATTLSKQRPLLLMAHPRAQPAEALVDLDQWVRDGGRVLLLADPMLEWPSERPLGDPLRPPPAFADTGLLKHWGLRLDAPDERGPQERRLGGQTILTASPGSLVGKCEIAVDGLVAHCHIGKGKATIVADADFLDVDQLDGPTSNNLKALVAELAALER